MEDIIIFLPIYHTIVKKKISKNILTGMNWYRNAHYIQKNNIKKIYFDLIQNQFRDKLINRMLVDIKYEVHYKLYYKSSACDMPNITAMMSKFLNDAIQELGLVKNDNVKFLVREVHEVVGEDKENPRCEIVIKEIKEF